MKCVLDASVIVKWQLLNGAPLVQGSPGITATRQTRIGR